MTASGTLVLLAGGAGTVATGGAEGLPIQFLAGAISHFCSAFVESHGAMRIFGFSGMPSSRHVSPAP